MKNIDTIAIGGFDGMHIGHQHLFARLGTQGAVVAIESGFSNLTPGSERERFTHHPLYYYQLDDIRHLDGAAFIARIEEDFPSLKTIVVGYDFHFGKNRRSSHVDLAALFKGDVIVIDEVMVQGDSVHSHKIRAKIQLGDIAGANAFLGHNYTIRGRVVSGQGIGKTELVPTINLEVERFLLPREGVYASLTRIDKEEHYHPSVSFVGHRVSTDGSFAIETHILDGGVVCRECAAISFVGFIRDNARYETLDALKAAIASDITIAERMIRQVSL